MPEFIVKGVMSQAEFDGALWRYGGGSAPAGVGDQLRAHDAAMRKECDTLREENERLREERDKYQVLACRFYDELLRALENDD